MNTKFYFFGPPRIEQAGELLSLKLQKALALLAFLVVNGQLYTREALATLLWPDYDQRAGRGRLRRTLYELNNVLRDNILYVTSDLIGLDLQADVWSDVEVFRRLTADHLPKISPQATLPQDALRSLEEAVFLYSDDFLAGFSLVDAPEFEEWRFFLAEELRQSLAVTLVQLATVYKQKQEWEPAVHHARRWLALDPLHEPAHRLLMRLFASSGRLAAAIRQYEHCVQILEEELGVAPEEETAALYEAIRTRRFRPETAGAASEEQGGKTTAKGDAAAPRYARHERVFAGGHAEVFRGEDFSSGETVAIKRLNAKVVTSDAELVARFIREGELLQQLNHPNIIRILDVVEEDGQQSIVMEYVDGGSLRDLLDAQGALPPSQALDIALPLADALVLAHESGVIHRDLKPDNVLLATDGTPRLTDFGLARLMHSNVRLTQHGAFLGTLAYMSPEAISGKTLDARSDIWSFGVMLYEMLAGERPFHVEPVSSLLASILYGPLPDLGPGTKIPAPLARLLQQIVVRDREKRLPTMRRLAAVLEAIRDERPLDDLLPEAPPAVAGSASAQRVEEAAFVVPHYLPARATPFIGRGKEMAAIAAFIADPQARLLTLLAPGGMGKTRLALAAARRLLDQAPPPASYIDGVYFVSLAPLDRADKIAQAIAQAMSLSFEANASAARTPERQLLEHLQARHLLLILDNFEHLPDGIPLVGDILREAPGVNIIATSRERLNLQEEHALTLRGLEYPPGGVDDPREIGDFAAVKLFVQSARRTRPDFVLREDNAAGVAHICRLVEGMPLAVELTAAWLDILPVADVAREVQNSFDFLETDKRDVPERQRSIRAVFETTWQRLNEAEQGAFARLSVFRGGFERAAAVEVSGITLRMLRHLVGKSLLQYEGIADRYTIHELLRQYSMQKLEEAGQADDVRDRHSAYFCALLHRYQSDIEGSNKRAALEAIERDIDNVFAAWKWAVSHGQVQRLDQAMHGLEHFFYWRSRIHEAEAFYGNAAEQVARVKPAPTVGETERRCVVTALLARHANFGYLLQNWDEARRYFQDGLETYEELEQKTDCDVRREKAYILMKMGDVTENIDEARAYFEQSLALYEAVGHRWWTAGLRCHLGYVALAAGRYDEARNWFEKSLALYRELDDRWQFGWVMDGLSNVALYQGELEGAEALAQESLVLHREIGLRDRIADNLTTLSWIALAQGRHDAAERYREEALAIWRDLGLEDRINVPVGLEDQPFSPRWFSDIIDRRIGAVVAQARGESGDAGEEPEQTP